MSEKFDPFKDPEYCADIAEFWANGGEEKNVPKSELTYDHRVTDVVELREVKEKNDS